MIEDEYNEFKKSTAELNDGIISISAILNKHRHGKLWFGLKNDGTPSRFEINDNTIRDVSRKIHEGIKPEIYPDIYTKIINEGEVIVVNFEGNNVPYSAFGRYYIRTADEDRELVPTELKHIWQERFYEENWENRISSETIDDIDDTVFRKFFAKALQCGRIPFEEYEKESLAKKLGILNGTKLTNAGRILFSKNHPLILKMAVFATDHKETFLDISRQEGNIFQLIDAAISYIVKNIRWRVELSSDYIHRNEIPEIPLGALRESVINSFAHAQYDIPVQHEIDVFSNRISIINPGSFANEFTPLDFAKGDLESRLRNPVIANTLYLCHDIEAFGSGLKKIYSLCEEHSVDISYSNQENVFKLEFSRFDRNSDCRTNDRISQNGTLMAL